MIYYCNFYFKSMNISEKFRATKKGPKNICFIYNYKIVHTKKLLGHLWL